MFIPASVTLLRHALLRVICAYLGSAGCALTGDLADQHQPKRVS